MSGYDREFTTIINLRAGFTTERGAVTRFFVQLEYWLDGEWLEVVRFDHDPASDGGHDITEDGLHVDVFRDGQKYRVETDFPPVELNRAPRYCTAYVREHADRLIRRFERWHDVSGLGH